MQLKKVMLDEAACCAMTHAFLRHPVEVRQWGQAVGPLQVLYEILSNTLSLSFVPNEQTVIVYRAFAAAELARLHAGGNRLICRHADIRHMAALQKLLDDLPADAGN